jgi:hypothetical protein
MRFTISLCALFVLMAEANARPATKHDPSIAIDPRAIKSHMAVLADDLFEGREAGTRGEALTALYIATRFETIGLEPAGDGATYLQRFPVRATTLDRKSVGFRIRTKKGWQNFPLGRDHAVYADPVDADTRIEGDVVFAGHGIVAPAFGLDDYAGLDVRGKIVAVLGGPPAFLPPVEAAHYSATDEQRRTALMHGAIGLIVLWTPALEARWPFDRFDSILDRIELDWLGPDGRPDAPTIPHLGWLRAGAANALFDAAPRPFADLIREAKTRSPKGFALATRASFKRRSRHDDSRTVMNVAGLLRGGDRTLAQEVVVLTAHHDHLGIGTPVKGDAIYNGAGDNALGTAALIEIAREIAAAERRPARSILFLAVGGEEKGLIGSDYFAAHPTIPREKLIADINIDGALAFYDFSDVLGFGVEHSELCERLADAAGDLGLSLSPDPFPEQSMFTRSDQYSFARRGVPSLFLFNGFTDTKGENIGRSLWDTLGASMVHQPNDDMSQPWDYAVIAKFADVARRLALALASAPERPRWYEDSVFAGLFAAGLPRAKRPDRPPVCATR